MPIVARKIDQQIDLSVAIDVSSPKKKSLVWNNAVCLMVKFI
jgi:hypothetical protein